MLQERSKMDVASGLPTRYVDVICQFTTDFIVSGIAPLDHYIVLLSYMADMAELANVDVIHDGPRQRKKARAPEVHVLDLHGEPIANDVLSLVGFEHYQANDYRLEYLPAENPAENSFYIVSPKDIVVAKPRDLEDHIEWLVERKKYHEALRAAEGAGPSYAGRLQVNSIVEIGQKYMGTLMESGQYEEAAKTCPKVLRSDAQLWEHWIYSFVEAKQLSIIRPYIPVDNPKLSSTVYELVLVHYLNSDLETFVQILKQWPSSIYNITHVIDAVELALKSNPDNRLLMDSATELYRFAKRWDMVLFYGLKLRQPAVLPMIQRYNLYAFVEEHIMLIMEYDQHMVDNDPTVAEEIARAVTHQEERTELGDVKGSVSLGRIRAAGRCPGVQVLATSTDRVPIAHVVEQLKNQLKYLHVFLDAEFRKDPHEASEYHSLQVELYAEFDYPRMLEFLRSSTYYSVEKAYAICEARDLVPEMVFLLGKMGDNRRALMLIIERLGDVARAIEFARDQNDEELWEDLLKYSMDKPAFIVGLLENLGSHINPIRLVQRIPNGLEIPGLRNALIKIMSDYGIQMSLREGCEKILVSDTVELLAGLVKARKRGLALSDIVCSMCEAPVTTYDPTGASNLVVFFCRHAYHSECLDAAVDAKAKGTVATSTSSAAVRATEAMSASVDRAVRLVYAQPKLDGESALDEKGAVEVVQSKTETRTIGMAPIVRICPICRNASNQKGRGGERKKTRAGADLVMRRSGTSMF
ncbi:Vacuolar protein sorting-associated protein 41 [Rhizophlyctis rosea]|nr:Vacuolar protein sorting-associated protein 41 [Rhizophlyctis rosea]